MRTWFASDGADALKLDAVQLKPQGYCLVAKEVVRVLAEFDVLDTAIPWAARAGVIIRSKDESRPAAANPHVAGPPKRAAEVVNDGSSDHTKDVIATAEGMNIAALHNATPAGRSAAN